MYLIDYTYFHQECYIPNLNEIDSDNLKSLNQRIDRDVPDFLLNLLGVDLFTELETYIVDGALINTAPQKWKDLVNGVVYDSKKWEGLVYQRGDYKGSILAKLVYANALRSDAQTNTGVGIKILSAQNATDVNPTQSIVTAENNFVREYQGDFEFTESILSVINLPIQKAKVSLIEYLEDHEVDFPTANLVLLNYSNSLGL